MEHNGENHSGRRSADDGEDDTSNSEIQQADEKQDQKTDADDLERSDDEGDLTVGEQDYDDDDDDEDNDLEEIKMHPSYHQVLLDVNRCAGRFEHIRKCYLHRTDDDLEPPEDLTEELEFQRVSGTHKIDGHSEQSSDEKEQIEPEQQQQQQGSRVNMKESEKVKRISKDLKYQRKLKKRLAKLILRLLIKKPDLHYYQGFHDVCLTYMTIYGEKEALQKLDIVVDFHFSVFMQPTMQETQEFLDLIPVIIRLKDPQVAEFLERSEVGTIFALSWVITWFSHVIPNEHDVEELYIALESSDDPHFILYICAALVLHKRDDLLRLEPEMSTVHKFLSQLPRRERLPIDLLRKEALDAYNIWRPNILKFFLEKHRRDKLQVHKYNPIAALARRLMPGLGRITTSNKTAIIVFVVASALVFQYDRWIGRLTV